MKTPDYSQILSSILDAKQLDQIHGSIIQLTEIMLSGEMELFLEQPRKSAKQKVLFLNKLFEALPAPELKEALVNAANQEQFAFFLTANFRDWLNGLQAQAEQTAVFKLTTAVDLKPIDRKAAIKLLSSRLEQPVVLELTIDSSLMGGAIIRHDTKISDFSLRTRLIQFRQSWRTATLETDR